jgi:hypothetical protein
MAKIAKRNRIDAQARWGRAGDEDVSSYEDREPPLGSSDEDDEEEETVVTTVSLAGK